MAIGETSNMFRKMRRFKQEVSKEECVAILNSEIRGVLSLIGDDNYPYGVPVDFYYDLNENAIYIHGAKEGHKIDSIKNNNKVCFTTYNKGFLKEGDWALNSTSVIIFGKAELINDINIAEDKCRKLALKIYPNKEEIEDEIKSAIDRVQLIKINIEHMSGKLINEK